MGFQNVPGESHVASEALQGVSNGFQGSQRGSRWPLGRFKLSHGVPGNPRNSKDLRGVAKAFQRGGSGVF